MKSLFRLVLSNTAQLFLICGILCMAAFAQTASINGTVTDSSSALVQHAKVTALNTATNVARSADTGTGGVYSLSELTPGSYDITIEKDGFRAVKFGAVKLTVDQALTLNATMQVGATQEEVTVQAGAATVDTTDAELSDVVGHTQMTELPLILRDPYQLVLLSPGVTQSDNMGGISANGGRERNNNFMLDGADNNDTEVPGILGGLTAQNPDSTEEFRIITNNFAPEYGRNNGAVIDVVTRSGTNNFHGDVFYFGRWDALGARDYFNHQIDPNTGLVAPKAPYIRNLYGASIGGPIVKNKTFFFVNYQGDRFVTNLTNASIVPTEAFKSGIFSYTNLQTGATQAINVTQPGSANNATGVGLDPVMQRILSLYPAPSAETGDGVTGTLFFPSESREKDEDGTLKIDHTITKNNTLSGRYVYNWFHDPNPFHTDFLPGGLGAIPEYARTQGLSIALTSNPSPTLVNVARASANRNNSGFGCTGTGVFNSFGFIDQVGRGADFTLPGYSGFGCQLLGDTDAQVRKTGTYQYTDTLTKVLGKHTMKYGAELREVYSNNFSSFASRALFNFTTFSSDGIAPLQNLNSGVDSTFIEDNTAMLLGLTSSQFQTQFFSRTNARMVNDELDFRSHEVGLFGQDEWKVMPNLTFTYGLRWEYYGVPYEAHGNISNLFANPSGAAPFTFSPVGPGTGKQLFQNYYRNFEPRFGFAWDPFKQGKTSIRGGIGAFSDRVYGNLISDARGNPPFQPSVFNQPVLSSGTTLGAQLQNQSAPAQLLPSPVVTNLDPTTFSGGLIFPDLFAHNIRPPSVVSWNFGFQHQLNSRLTIEANYVGNHGTRVLRVVDGNAPQPALVNQLLAAGVAPSTLQFNNLYDGAELGIMPFDAVNNNAFLHAFVDETSGHSWYNGLQAQVTEKNLYGLQIQLSYTWSHALDDSSDPLPGADTSGNGDFPVDSFLLNHEFGNSGFDTRQRAVINFIYQPNIGRGKNLLSTGVLGRVFEGWEISGIASFQTGLPYDIFGPLDTLHTGVPNGVTDRATVVNPSILKTIPSTGKFFAGGVFTGFNPAAFNLEDGVNQPIPWGIPANVVRNNWYGPGVNNWNVSFSKTTALTERVKFQFRFETYNLFNRVQFAKPANLAGSVYNGQNFTSNPDFGYSLSQVGQNDGTTGARQIQLGAKFLF